MRRWTRDVAAAALSRLRPRRGKRIIVLHEVADGARLRETLSWLTRHYDVVPLATLLSDRGASPNAVAVTFDDGYRSWYDAAAPVLTELSIPAVFFICSGFVGLGGRAAEAFCRTRLRRRRVLEPLDPPQVRELAANRLFEVGSHTVTHANLGAAADAAVIETEIGDDRRRLEDWTGTPVRWFAYPFGQPENTSPAVERYLDAHGFAAAFTLTPSFVQLTNRFAVGRDSLDLTRPTWVWQGRLGGGYDALSRLKRRIRGASR